MFITRQRVNLPSEIILSGLVVKFVDRFKRHLFSYKLFKFYPDFKDSIWTENDKVVGLPSFRPRFAGKCGRQSRDLA